MDKVTRGELDEDVAMKDGAKEGEGVAEAEKVEGNKVEEDVGVEPPSPEFVLELPSISPIDLCVPSRPLVFLFHCLTLCGWYCFSLENLGTGTS